MTAGSSRDEDDFRDRIYEASVLPEFWPGVLREFAEFAESRDACVIATSEQTYKWVGSSEAMQALVQETYDYPGGHERTRRLLAAEPQGFITDLDVYTESELRAEPLYTKCLIPRGLGRGIATVIRLPMATEAIAFSLRSFSASWTAIIQPRSNLSTAWMFSQSATAPNF